MEDVRRRLSRRLLQLRTDRGWSQEDLGARSGLTYKFIGEVERGQKSPSLDSLDKLARGLGVDIADLLAPPDGREAYPRHTPDPLVAVREAKASLERVLDKARRVTRRRK